MIDKDKYYFKPQGNTFIDKCMFYMLICVCDRDPDRLARKFEMTLQGDNSFYS